MKKKILYVIAILIVAACTIGVFWYIKNNVDFVTKDERRTIVVTELTAALERYYDEHGRYPNVETNDALIKELSTKAYLQNDVRVDVIQYVPINYGQRYELQ